MKKKRVAVSDLMQRGYVYFLVTPAGRNFDPDFRPELTPKEMLELGVFGGKYLTDCQKEFPASWFKRAKLCHERHDPTLNYFGVNASQPLSVWRKNGWLYEEDPRGWFQWYCRYYLGRRSVDDQRQIKRWRAVRRHIAQLKLNCPGRALDCRPRQDRLYFTGLTIRAKSEIGLENTHETRIHCRRHERRPGDRQATP